MVVLDAVAHSKSGIMGYQGQSPQSPNFSKMFHIKVGPRSLGIVVTVPQIASRQWSIHFFIKFSGFWPLPPRPGSRMTKISVEVCRSSLPEKLPRPAVWRLT